MSPVPVTRALVPLTVLAVAAAAALPAAARAPRPPTVDIHTLAGLAPDARSVTVQVLASCEERASVVEASVTVSQPSGSGRASIPLRCVGFAQPFTVVVPVQSGTFTLGTADVTATVAASRAKVQRATDSEVVSVEPRVDVELGESARLAPGGASVVLDVTVACPAGTTGVQSSVGVSQALTRGAGSYLPVCDGRPRTFAVTVIASQGAYVQGVAQALTFTDVVWQGRTFTGVDDDGALELVQ